MWDHTVKGNIPAEPEEQAKLVWGRVPLAYPVLWVCPLETKFKESKPFFLPALCNEGGG